MSPAAAVETTFVPGPTYDEMLDPRKLPASIREAAQDARNTELNPLNLFNITWRNPGGDIRRIVLPRELTGTKANIVVLLGFAFPSGSHKVGPAYSTLAENEVSGAIKPGMVMVGPSTGNFGIGVAYVSRLKGYEALVVMPEGMSAERYERIRKYGGKLDLTPGSESDVVLVLERVEEIRKDPNNFILAQFELMPNYRFHRHVTGNSCLEAVAGVGNGKIAAFVSAPGSAGTLAAGDAIKAKFPTASIVAVEPKECSTLFNGGQGTHRIEGIGDKMVVLIHNVRNTDYIMMVHDDDTVKGLRVLSSGLNLGRLSGASLSSATATDGVCPRCHQRVEQGEHDCFRACFGISSVCNILGAIRTAHHLGLGVGDNVVTIATDGYDRYPSVMEELGRRAGREGQIGDDLLEQWHEEIFGGYSAADFLDVRPREQQQRLFSAKQEMWTRFGYSDEYLETMKSAAFWEDEYSRVPEVNAAIERQRDERGAWEF
ncbi:MAG: PLP-dependent cysteine synthase family protein [Candidatus Sumerlaeaceae bacterium]